MFQHLPHFFRRSHRRLLYGLMSVITAFSIWIGSYQQPAYSISWLEILLRGVQIYQLSSLSDAQEIQLGQQINQQISRQVPISRNQELTDYIDEIGQLLAHESTRPQIPYTFQVVNDNSINAFATMGGFVYINTGLMKLAANEAELASVIGHEIAHIEARHAVNQMKEQAITQGLLSAAGLDESTAVQIGVQLALSLPHSREDELEADRLGLESLTKAGYAPIGMVDFMTKLQANSQGSPPTFLSTHPATGDRIIRLQQNIDPQTATDGYGLNSNTYQQNTQSLY